MTFASEIAEGLEEIAEEAARPMTYRRIRTGTVVSIDAYCGKQTEQGKTEQASLLDTSIRIVYVHDWRTQLVDAGQPFEPEAGDRILDGDLELYVAPARVIGGQSEDNVTLANFVGERGVTIGINTKVFDGVVP